MAKLPLVYLPDPRLREVSTPFDRVDDDVRRLAADMLETMAKHDGLGLAGPQVGALRRILVIDVPEGTDLVPDDRKPNPIVMINPRILSRSDERRMQEEGCLSIPEVRIEIERPAHITLEYLDRDGRRQQRDAHGLMATVIQHEIDHLDGRLIIDFFSKLRRDMIIRKFRKLAKAGELGD